MVFDGAIKIVIEKPVRVEMKKIAEKNRVFLVNLFPVFGIEVKRTFLIVSVVSFFVVLFYFNLVDVTIVDVWE